MQVVRCSVVILFAVFSTASTDRLHSFVKQFKELSDDDYKIVDGELKGAINRAFKALLPYAMELNERLNLSPQCKMELFRLVSEIRKMKLSAFEFFDATGKLSSGLFGGNMFMYGDFEQCLTASIINKNGDIAFRGKYCLVQIESSLMKEHTKENSTASSRLNDFGNLTNMSELTQFVASNLLLMNALPPKIGLCVPTGCSVDDVNQMLSAIVRSSFIEASVVYCDYEGFLPTFTTGRIIAVFVFSVVGLIVLLGSGLECYSKVKKIAFQSLSARILLCFSVLTNFPKLLSTKGSQKNTLCLHGIRALSLFYVVYTHRYAFSLDLSMEGHLIIKFKQLKEFFFQAIANAYFVTDTFFLLGGFVNIHSRMQLNENSKRSMSPLLLIFYRLWRIYPTYIAAILFAYLMNSYGPLRIPSKAVFVEPCDRNWWKSLLFISNIVDGEDACLMHGWYIPSDMHLFLISVFTIPILMRSPKKGIILHLAVILCGVVVTALWVWKKNVMPTFVWNSMSREGILDIFRLYALILPHVACYCIGILVGYFQFTRKEIKISMAHQVIGWLISVFLFTSMLFVSLKWNASGEYTVLESTFYFPLSRILYGMAIAWMIICCTTGHGGVVNYILSLEVWMPISRISYMVYLISPIIQIFYNANMRMTVDITNMILIWTHFGDIAVCCLLGLVLVAFFESPFIALQKMLFFEKSLRGEEHGDMKAYDNPEVTVGNMQIPESENNIKNSLTFEMKG